MLQYILGETGFQSWWKPQKPDLRSDPVTVLDSKAGSQE